MGVYCIYIYFCKSDNFLNGDIFPDSIVFPLLP